MTIDFTKGSGLVPAVIQDVQTNKVLMLGFMNEEALLKTQTENRVTFFSRTKNRLWTKGEESGHFLEVVSIQTDCDNDTLLVKVNPNGPVCHTGTDTCWGEVNEGSGLDFLYELEAVIAARKNLPDESSYTSQLFAKGINKIAQKVGEEAIELVIEAKDNNNELFLNEAADLLFHYLILLHAKEVTLKDIAETLKKRRK
jgi:phosphoribosyl-ATP pyrophosphohydrolase/phosphoribosyl-AMP cyclohydrolase